MLGHSAALGYHTRVFLLPFILETDFYFTGVSDLAAYL